MPGCIRPEWWAGNGPGYIRLDDWQTTKKPIKKRPKAGLFFISLIIGLISISSIGYLVSLSFLLGLLSFLIGKRIYYIIHFRLCMPGRLSIYLI